jgi:hypothetical protein
MKTFLRLLAIIEVIVAVASPLVPFRFHGDAGYLTGAVVYALVLIGPVTGLAALWAFATAPLVREVFELASVDAEQEVLVYVFLGVVESFFSAWFLPLKKTYQPETMFKAAANYTAGFFFVGGVLAAALGILLVLKGLGSGKVARATTTPTDYDNIR